MVCVCDKAVCERWCVCVEHLKRCKTSTSVKVSLYIYTFGFHLIYSCLSQAQVSFSLGRLVRSRFFFSKQGAAGNVIVLQPTKTAMTFCDIDPGRWIDVPASFSFHVNRNGTWLTQEPPCRFAFQTVLKPNQTFSFQIQVVSVPVRFSQSVFQEHVVGLVR